MGAEYAANQTCRTRDQYQRGVHGASPRWSVLMDCWSDRVFFDDERPEAALIPFGTLTRAIRGRDGPVLDERPVEHTPRLSLLPVSVVSGSRVLVKVGVVDAASQVGME